MAASGEQPRNKPVRTAAAHPRASLFKHCQGACCEPLQGVVRGKEKGTRVWQQRGTRQWRRQRRQWHNMHHPPTMLQHPTFPKRQRSTPHNRAASRTAHPLASVILASELLPTPLVFLSWEADCAWEPAGERGMGGQQGSEAWEPAGQRGMGAQQGSAANEAKHGARPTDGWWGCQAAAENETCTQQADRLHRSTRHDAPRR